MALMSDLTVRLYPFGCVFVYQMTGEDHWSEHEHVAVIRGNEVVFVEPPYVVMEADREMIRARAGDLRAAAIRYGHARFNSYPDGSFEAIGI